MKWDKTSYDAGRYMDREYYTFLGRCINEASYHYRNKDVASFYDTIMDLIGNMPDQVLPKTEEGKDAIMQKMEKAHAEMGKNRALSLYMLWSIRRQLISILYENNMLFSTFKKRDDGGVYV